MPQTENAPEAFPNGYLDVDEAMEPFMSITGEEPSEGWCRWFLEDKLRMKDRKDGWKQSCRAKLRELIRTAFEDGQPSGTGPA